MGWGGGWGNHVGNSLREVAKAFYAGKRLVRSSCETDGETYWFVTTDKRWDSFQQKHVNEKIRIAIAKRIRDEDMAKAVLDAIGDGPVRVPLCFTTAGWRTQTTARHFCALGLDAEAKGTKNPRFKVNGRWMPDDWLGWFSKEDVQSWPEEHPEDKKQRECRERRARNRAMRQAAEFEQATMALF